MRDRDWYETHFRDAFLIIAKMQRRYGAATDCQKTIVLSLRDPAGVVAAQPLAALPPYGCGVPLAGAISQNNFASCMFSGEYEIFLIREALNKSARAVSERFCSKLRFENRRNTLCISRFSNRKVGTKDPLSAAADLFGGSLDCHVAVLFAMTRRGLFRHADATPVRRCKPIALYIFIGFYIRMTKPRQCTGLCTGKDEKVRIFKERRERWKNKDKTSL